MTKTVKVCIVGAGNISNTRHIPALKKSNNVEIVGVISNNSKKCEETAIRNKISNYAVISEDIIGSLSKPEVKLWFDEVEAVIIGAPPLQHYQLVKSFLKMGKHVLIEKPMMMNNKESSEVISLAKKLKLLLYVMHNFQYATKMKKLTDIIESKNHGEIVSITEIQFTNHDRRLPEWYNDLPMGLFFDEAAHFIYLLERHAGKVKIDSSYAVYDKDKSQKTPITLNVAATAGKIPVTMMLNFHTAVCEWQYIVHFKKRIYIYDFFKDILIDLPTDNEHLAKDIFRNSLSCTFQYWSQFIHNGLKMVTGNLLYGHDIVIKDFANAILGKKPDPYLTADNGKSNVITINDIIKVSNIRND